MRLSLPTILLLGAPSANAFLGFSVTKSPGLDGIIASQTDQKLVVNLDIGQEGDASRFAVKGMTFNLKNSVPDYEPIAMPGINGPHPNLSSGHRAIDLLQEGEFVSMKGCEKVQALQGSWEMVWKEDSPAGVILCGFEIPQDYSRNDATLPKGRIYLSFPVWTKDTLSHAQSEKERIMARAQECIDQRTQALRKCEEERNPILKALHFREACSASEKYDIQPLNRIKQVPGDDEVMAIQDDLFLTTKGLIWSKVLPRGEQILLGTANVSPFQER